jgi:hypothetical protein
MFDLFNQPPQLPFTGTQLRDIGMKMATDHADEKSEAWTDKAYRLLEQFANTKGEFTCEEFRAWARYKIDSPPSLRAFGGIIHRAAHNELIEQVGTVRVKNPKAHRANAALWRKKQ